MNCRIQRSMAISDRAGAVVMVVAGEGGTMVSRSGAGLRSEPGVAGIGAAFGAKATYKPVQAASKVAIADTIVQKEPVDAGFSAIFTPRSLHGESSRKNAKQLKTQEADLAPNLSYEVGHSL
jgi:hypothetical protein